jgi:hypothetical protein
MKLLSMMMFSLVLNACGTMDDNLKVECVESHTNSWCEVSCVNNDTCKGK